MDDNSTLGYILVKRERNEAISKGTLTCQKMLSSIITVVSARLGPERQNQVRELVQQLVVSRMSS